MSEITKFLMDDHHRLRRSFNGYQADSNSLEAALHVCDQIWMHSVIEEEFLYPALKEIDPAEAEESAADHEFIAELMAKIDQADGSDAAALPRLMSQLRKVMEDHAKHEERNVFPRLTAHDESPDLGRAAFARRQELMTQRPPRTVRRRSLANTGWGGGGPQPNAGW